MWKITRIKLVNNAFIFSGCGKHEIELDFTKANKNSKINLLIGPIGSGKTALLSQLQPFASVGTLDPRNSEDVTLPEVDGCKIIEYDHDGCHYVIHHDYVWNKTLKSHGTKSYISKDGTELNSNGNTGSFKEIIKIEFGIDQNFLRVLRLGNNVCNVVNLKTAERKRFIASLREDTDVYLMIYKKLNEDYRTLTASITAISNRLMQLSATDEDKMRDTLARLMEESDQALKEIKEYESKIGKLQGANQTLGDLKSLTVNYQHMEATLESLHDQYLDIKTEVENAGSDETLESISNKIGRIQSTINGFEERLMKNSQELESVQRDINRFNDIIMMSDNDSHLEDMKRVLKDLEAQYQDYTIKLSGFECKYSYHFLASFIDDLNVLQNMIEELSQYDPDTIRFLMARLDQSINGWVTNKVNTLMGKRTNLQKAMNTIEYCKEYFPPIPLFRAPFCPTNECPYYTTHPEIIRKRSGNKKETAAKLSRLKDEITRVDAEISKYQEYTLIQKKLQLLVNQWKTAYGVLRNLNVVNDIRLIDLLTDTMSRRDWYHYYQLVSILEKCKMRDEYNEISLQYASVKEELARLQSPEYEASKYKKQIAEKRKAELTAEMREFTSQISQLKAQLEDLEILYHVVQKKDANIKQLSIMQTDMEKLQSDMETMNQSIKKIEFNNDQIAALKNKLNGRSITYQDTMNKIDRLKATLSQIAYNQDEYQSLMKQRTTMKAILDAVSAKEGIPLVLIKVFLDNCKEIINELIADVFEDDLEILDFNITETDFKIPYVINGQVVEDIEYASQGQQSIISIALSFALVQQSIFDYNIMLLDEVDGPLHFSDREKFIGILFKQMAAIHSDQVFMISHSNGIFEGNPVNIIMTADEDIETSNRQVIMRL